ncbi:hypothetical protein E3N88_22692 [Mikania micrantha]|uniref:Uncharacterized protein n=1 Tax=Mikania micrantha TaxID=192012 RepID=A0A5N6NB66_9ASTR|nr:hypothetical protein E3N88_22692 [Mikania micrantha]
MITAATVDSGGKEWNTYVGRNCVNRCKTTSTMAVYEGGGLKRKILKNMVVRNQDCIEPKRNPLKSSRSSIALERFVTRELYWGSAKVAMHGSVISKWFGHEFAAPSRSSTHTRVRLVSRVREAAGFVGQHEGSAEDEPKGSAGLACTGFVSHPQIPTRGVSPRGCDEARITAHGHIERLYMRSSLNPHSHRNYTRYDLQSTLVPSGVSQTQ